jgi:hypothetical protein
MLPQLRLSPKFYFKHHNHLWGASVLFAGRPQLLFIKKIFFLMNLRDKNFAVAGFVAAIRHGG